MNIYPKSNHYSVIGEPTELAHIAATISETADALFENCDAFSFNIEDFRTGSAAEQGRKALAWILEYYTIVRVSALNIATLADILYTVLLDNNYIFAPDKTEEN